MTKSDPNGKSQSQESTTARPSVGLEGSPKEGQQPLAKQTANGQQDRSDDSMREKIILVIIEVVFIGGILFVFGQKYNSLKAFDDVKWQRTRVMCLDSACSTGRETIKIYRLGETAIRDVRLTFALDDADYQIVGGSQSVKQYEKGFEALGTKYLAPGRGITFNDSELTSANAYGFNLTELSPNWIYVLVVDSKLKALRKDNPFQDYAIFEIEAAGRTFDHEGLVLNDYLRLYLIEASVLGVFLLIVLATIIWFLFTYLVRKKGVVNEVTHSSRKRCNT